MGTADQLMDLSLTHPYPGENKLVDRLLAIKDVSEKYQKLLKELSEKVFTKEQLLKEIEAIEKVTKEPLAKEKKAAEARKEAPAGFGPPGGAAPQPPDLRTFAEKRTASVAAQLAGKSKGYVPAGFGFGPPPGGGGGPGGGGAEPADRREDVPRRRQGPARVRRVAVRRPAEGGLPGGAGGGADRRGVRRRR